MIKGQSGSQLDQGVSFIDDSKEILVSMEAEMEALKAKGMVEHIVYKAVDGLEKGQSIEVKRSSLLSLLSISHSNMGRRILRNQSLVKQLLGALQNLDFDDIPTKLAALSIYDTLSSNEGTTDKSKTTPLCHLGEDWLEASTHLKDDISSFSNLPVVDISDATCQSKEHDMPPRQAIQEQEGTWLRKTFWRINAFIFNHNNTDGTQRAHMDADEVHREEMFYCKIFLVGIWLYSLIGVSFLSWASSHRAQ